MKTIGMTILLGVSSASIPALTEASIKQGFELHMDVPQAQAFKVYSTQPSKKQTQATTQFVLANGQFDQVGAINTNGCNVSSEVSPSGKILTLSYQGQIENTGNGYVVNYQACKAHVNVVVNGEVVDNRINAVIRHTPNLVANTLFTNDSRLDVASTNNMQAFSYALSE